MVRMTGGLTKDVPAMETVASFLEAGYARLGDFLAKGEIVPRDFEKSQLLAYTFRCQGLHPDHPFEDAASAATALLGLRSDFAARLRVRAFEPLERLHRRGTLSKGLGIPDYYTYCTEPDLMLFKRAKNASVTKEMRQVLSVIREDEPISPPRLLALSPIRFTGTTRALKKLYEGSQVTRGPDNRYRSVRDLRIPVDEARKAVMRRNAESLGVFSAEAVTHSARSSATLR